MPYMHIRILHIPRINIKIDTNSRQKENTTERIKIQFMNVSEENLFTVKKYI